jgi:hypothetical protein
MNETEEHGEFTLEAALREAARETNPVTPGDVVFVAVRGAFRSATVLAMDVGRNEMLIEIDMPGYTSLRVVDPNDANLTHRHVSYRSVPRHWLEAIVANDLWWHGYPVGGTDATPSAHEMLATLDKEKRDGE